MTAANKALVQRWFDEIWNQGRAETIDELMAEQAEAYTPAGEARRGRAGFKAFHAAYRQALPDLRVTLHEIVAEGDMVSVRWTASGTHTGEGLGLPATNKRLEIPGFTMARISGGQVVVGWDMYDQLNLFQQLGIVAAPV